MKKIILLFLLYILEIHPYVYSQTLSSSVQNSGGLVSTNQNVGSITYSIGEMTSILQYTGSNNYILSTGFLQAFTPLVTGINDLFLIPNASVSIAPNPTSLYIQIQTSFKQMGILQFQLLDAQSKIHFQQVPVNINGQFQNRIDLNEFPSGIYYVKMMFQPNQGPLQQSVYKIIKL